MSEETPSIDSVVVSRVSERLKLDAGVCRKALELLTAGMPVSYLARYRLDDVGGLGERTLLDMRADAERIREMEQRREFILRAIAERSDVSEKMRRRIARCRNRTELEYLYEPFRPPRKTPGSLARQSGLEPLANALLAGEEADPAAFVKPDGAANEEEAWSGARHILAERFAVDPEVRGAMLRAIEKEGVIQAAPAHGKSAIPERFGQFKTYEEKLGRAPSHRFLALRRAETEGALCIQVSFPEEKVLHTIRERFYPKECSDAGKEQLDRAAAGTVRMLRPAVCEDALRAAKERADREAIRVFSNNLGDLLTYPPAGPRRVLGVDPAPRGAIAVACVDERGNHLEHARLKFFDRKEEKVALACETILRLVRTHKVEMVALGNGQGRHACEGFLAGCLEQLGEEAPLIVVVNEVGVGAYASGPVGRAELPALSVPVRGAVSLARRLIDPMPELVKVDPKQIGVGQYQGDVDARRLGRALAEVVEHCVCWVGVDVNRAPVQQIASACGLSTSVARSLVEHREKHGPFPTLASLKDLHFISERAFEQAAGFLRIRGGSEPLDATGVHPSHFELVERIARSLTLNPADLIGNTDVLSTVVAEDYADAKFSPATVAGVLYELAEAGKDPRPPLEVITRPAGVRSASDLTPGMRLSGRVTNVTNFGAFVDLGVQQDGLVHVSELADRFVKDPTSVVHVGQTVSVKVIGVDTESGRISLSMKSGRGGQRPRRAKGARRPRRERRPSRDEKPARKEEPAAAPEKAQAPEPEPAPATEDPVPSDMTEEEFMKHKLEELRKRFS